MSKLKRSTIEVQGSAITIVSQGAADFISLTDIARYRSSQEPFSVINNWMRTRSTIEFLGLWEKLCNPSFKPVEFERFKNEAGSNYFVLSPQRWIATTSAIGITSSAGRYGGTFAHRDIAFEFASWISPEFKLYLIVEFQRLKDDENHRLKLDWNLQRTLAKINYRIHTASTPTPSKRRSSRHPSPRHRPRSSMPTKPTCSTSPSSAKPPNNGATPIPTPKATSAITPSEITFP